MSATEPGTRLLLARHAETSAPDRFHGAESDVGLSAWGTLQAERLGQALRDASAAALYCSALRRAVETAIPLGRACGLEPVIIEALHERRIGPLSGMSRGSGKTGHGSILQAVNPCSTSWTATSRALAGSSFTPASGM